MRLPAPPSRNSLLIVLLLAVTLWLAASGQGRPDERLLMPLKSIPTEIEGWSAGIDDPLTREVRNTLNADDYLSRTYRRGLAELQLFVAFYADQRTGAAPHSPAVCLPGSGWEPVARRTVEVPREAGSIAVSELIVRKDGAQMLVLYWYQSAGSVSATEYSKRLRLAWDAIVRGRRAGALVRVSVPDGPEALPTAVAFAARLLPQVQRCVGRL